MTLLPLMAMLLASPSDALWVRYQADGARRLVPLVSAAVRPGGGRNALVALAALPAAVPVDDLHRGVRVLLEALADLATGPRLEDPLRPRRDQESP